jgi:CRISPR-associated protein Cst1
MKIKVYLNEWFYNIGLIGLIRLLEYAKENDGNIEFQIKEDHVVFEDSFLKKFHEYYFQYLYEQYLPRYHNIVNFIKNFKIENGDFSKFKKFIDNKILTKAGKIGIDISDFSEKLKSLEKKFSENEFNEFKNKIIELLEYEKLRDKFFLDDLRTILYDNFFGQVSFLQKNFSIRSLEEHKKTLYLDFVLPALVDLYIEKGCEKELIDLENFLEENKNIKKMERLLKKIKKRKNFEAENSKCLLCNLHNATEDYFSESNFLILGVSNDNSSNFFWEFEPNLPICKICKIVLLASPLGVTQLYDKYRKISYFSFVNLDTTLIELRNINETFKNLSEYSNPYRELIYNYLTQVKKKSEWTLQNILFVEFFGEYQAKKASLNYFYINKIAAIFFKTFSRFSIDKIKDENFKRNIIDYILKGSNYDNLIFSNIKEKISNGYSLDSYYAAKSKGFLEYIKAKEGRIMENGSERNFDEIMKKTFYFGRNLADKLRESGKENKIQTLAYRLLNAAKIGNKKEFMDTILRTYISIQENVPKILVDSLGDHSLSFETIAQLFISGLIYKTSINQNEVNESNGVLNENN